MVILSLTIGAALAAAPAYAQSGSPTTVSVTYSSYTTPTIETPTLAPFPPVGSINRTYDESGLEQLWSLVGPVASPPITTTVEPSLPVALPTAPPPLYPTWFNPTPADLLPNLTFPSGFLFGVATAAYQVEGAADVDGKGPSGWDWASRQTETVTGNTTADISDLHYYLYKQDVGTMASLGVRAHSFSISWARIYPFGAADSPLNQAGLDHYKDVIAYHHQLGITPVVTIFHWDLPLALITYYGGFTSPQIVDDYVNYATTLFKAFNGTVDTWITFNEPGVYCNQVAIYPFNATFATGVNETTAQWQCSYNLLRAHAGAVKAFRDMGITGEIGFKNNDFVGAPWRSNSSEDQEAVERHAAFGIGIWSDPVYTTGDYPPIVKESLPESWLPRFTPEESALLKGSADFFAIDAYASLYVRAPPTGLASCITNFSNPAFPACNEVALYDSSNLDYFTDGGEVQGWSVGPSPDVAEDSWLQSTPQMLRSYLGAIHARWPTNKMYISEFGFGEPFENERTELFRITEDVDRTNYFLTYLGEALLAIHEDGIPLMGTFAWSIMDNVEWYFGQSTRFGIQFVNYTTLERIPKRSAFAMSEFFAAHLVD